LITKINNASSPKRTTENNELRKIIQAFVDQRKNTNALYHLVSMFSLQNFTTTFFADFYCTSLQN